MLAQSPLRKIANTLAFLVLAMAAIFSHAQVIAVEALPKGDTSPQVPTLTFLWPNDKAQAVLIFIPGGDGHLGLTSDKKNLGGFYGAMLRPLSDPALSAGKFEVVVFDSPTPLPVGTVYPYSRTSADHLMRLDSVVLHYQQKFHKPIWLMGHSNGAVSVTEYLKYLQRDNRQHLVSGMVYSSARHGADFAANTQLPVLFLAHEKDGCKISTPSASKLVYEKLKQTNTQSMQYVVLKNGEEQAANPCVSGYHMFYGAGAEAYQAIDAFAAAYFP